MRIRRASDADFGEIKRMDAAIFPGDSGLDIDAQYWVAPGAAFAAAKLLEEEGLLYLYRAGVLPKARGRGLQKRMIRARLRWGRANECAQAVTFTTNWNTVSMRNLIRCGFLPYTPSFKWAGEGVVYWARDL
jgi:GNAT superfamily N-acetyltransferase